MWKKLTYQLAYRGQFGQWLISVNQNPTIVVVGRVDLLQWATAVAHYEAFTESTAITSIRLAKMCLINYKVEVVNIDSDYKYRVLRQMSWS